jgi:hypothetical protein
MGRGRKKKVLVASPQEQAENANIESNDALQVESAELEKPAEQQLLDPSCMDLAVVGADKTVITRVDLRHVPRKFHKFL